MRKEWSVGCAWLMGCAYRWGQLSKERVHADHGDHASARADVSEGGVLPILELCRPVPRADSCLYYLGLDVVSFQVEPRDPHVFGRRLNRYDRRAAVAVREPQTGESDVRAEIDKPSGTCPTHPEVSWYAPQCVKQLSSRSARRSVSHGRCVIFQMGSRSPSHGKCSRRFCSSSQNCGRSHHQRQHETSRDPAKR
jgi:hypothetical protein